VAFSEEVEARRELDAELKTDMMMVCSGVVLVWLWRRKSSVDGLV
jgi:hypothetical protein